MGLFSKISEKTKCFNALAEGVGNITNLLDNYQSSKDEDYLLLAAWICKVGVSDNIINGQLNPQNWFAATIRGRLTKISVQEAYDMTIGRLALLVENSSDSLCAKIADIIDGGDAFEEIDCQMPDSKRKLFQVK